MAPLCMSALTDRVSDDGTLLCRRATCEVWVEVSVAAAVSVICFRVDACRAEFRSELARSVQNESGNAPHGDAVVQTMTENSADELRGSCARTGDDARY